MPKTIKQLIDEYDGSPVQHQLFVVHGLLKFGRYVEAIRHAAANITDDDSLGIIVQEIVFESAKLRDQCASATELPVPSDGTIELMTFDAKERQYATQLLAHFDWNKSRVCRILDIERSTLDRKLLKWGVTRPGDHQPLKTCAASHSTTAVLNASERGSGNWCSTCNDWFYPIGHLKAE